MDSLPTFLNPCAEPGGGGAIKANLAVTFSPAPDTVPVSDGTMTFHKLYERFAGDVYRFAHWLTGNPHDAHDITSETFARVWVASVSPKTGSVKAYLFTIARNLHRKQWRRASRLEELDETLPDPGDQPDTTAERQEEFQRTMAALQTLPELDRTLLLLRAEEDLSYDDIAATTGRPPPPHECACFAPAPVS